MQLGRVIGTVVATRKYEGLEGAKLLLVLPLDHALKPTGDPHVAVDTVQAGQGVVIIEAMKMENELRAPAGALVKEVLVSEGQNVEGSAVVVVFGGES